MQRTEIDLVDLRQSLSIIEIGFADGLIELVKFVGSCRFRFSAMFDELFHRLHIRLRFQQCDLSGGGVHSNSIHPFRIIRYGETQISHILDIGGFNRCILIV
ncbi:hypothetical protein SDC9_194160 [bioreactor metagenome]|uniref:Uncharacterized protein n=1 Tax=bioreactor metagenome TaxID=1076179 RepID=A0A645I635_9ZZZZ